MPCQTEPRPTRPNRVLFNLRRRIIHTMPHPTGFRLTRTYPTALVFLREDNPSLAVPNSTKPDRDLRCRVFFRGADNPSLAIPGRITSGLTPDCHAYFYYSERLIFQALPNRILTNRVQPYEDPPDQIFLFGEDE